MTTREFKYHPNNQPIPEGWKEVHDLNDCRHGVYAVLIERIKESGDDKQKD